MSENGEYVDLAQRLAERLQAHVPSLRVMDVIDEVFMEARRALLLGGTVSIGGLGKLTTRERPQRRVAGNLKHLGGRDYVIPGRRKLVVKPEWSFNRDLGEEPSESEVDEQCVRWRNRNGVSMKLSRTKVQRKA